MLLGSKRPRVLAIGAHPDDIEIGAGGFIYRLITERRAEVTFLVITPGVQAWQTGTSYKMLDRRREAEEAGKILRVTSVCVLELPDCELHNRVHEVTRHIEAFIYNEEMEPQYDIVLSHSGIDTHSDHVQVYKSTIASIRYFQGSLLLYQVPSTIPNEFKPNFFVGLTGQSLDMKIRAIMAHQSQRDKGRDFMQSDRIRGMATSWSLFHRLPRQGLEAFELYKSFWQIPTCRNVELRKSPGSTLSVMHTGDTDPTC